jgi:membrane fusion protein, multidrug efflux system
MTMQKFSEIALVALVAFALAACGESKNKQADAGKSAKDKPVTVSASVIAQSAFVDSLEAIGTAKARESVMLSSSVTDRIRTINFKDGQYVRKGQVLIELSQAEENADLSQARARQKEAEAQLDRVQSLSKQGYATRSRLDEQIAARDSARGAVASLEARVQDRVIRAPFSGVIGLLSISPGLVASANTPIVELSDSSVIKLDFTVPETSLSAVRVGQTVQAIAAAYPAQNFTGRVEAIDPQVDPVTRSVSLRALIPNPTGMLKPGMLLTVKIEQTKRMALAVPEQSLVAEGDAQSVFKVDLAGNTVEKVRVTTGARADGLVEITGGIAAGSTVVTDGTVKLRDGGKVKISGFKNVSQNALNNSGKGVVAR